MMTVLYWLGVTCCLILILIGAFFLTTVVHSLLAPEPALSATYTLVAREIKSKQACEALGKTIRIKQHSCIRERR